MTAGNWRARVEGDLSLSVPEDDPQREHARRLMALHPPESGRPPGPSGIDWANDPGALGAELRRLREASVPLVIALPPEAARAPEPVPESKPLGYLAVIRRDHGLTRVGSIVPLESVARLDAEWWAENVSPGAFVCELREVPR